VDRSLKQLYKEPYQRIYVEVSYDQPPSYGGMTTVARLTATVKDGEKTDIVGRALVCIPTDASSSRQGFLFMDIDTMTHDMDMVATVLAEKVSELPECANREVVFKYDGTLAEKLGWIEKHSADGVYILHPAFSAA
jgi:hypothetical protein